MTVTATDLYHLQLAVDHYTAAHPRSARFYVLKPIPWTSPVEYDQPLESWQLDLVHIVHKVPHHELRFSRLTREQVAQLRPELAHTLIDTRAWVCEGTIVRVINKRFASLCEREPLADFGIWTYCASD